jgi:oligopeptide transport system substrate-binding protein
MIKSVRRSSILLLLSACLVSACHSQISKPNSKVNNREILSIALPSTVETLDWNFSTDPSTSIIETNVMEGLTGIDIAGASVGVTPSLAEAWNISEDGLQYTFHLRENVKWSDGEPLTAQNFIDSFDRLLSPDSKAPWSESLFVVQGARNYHEGKLKKFSEVGIKAIDSKTLKFSLNEPVGYFLALFSHHSTFPIRKDLIDGNKAGWSNPKQIVTLGAFQVDQVESSKRLTLKRNEKFFLKKPVLKSLIFYMGLKTKEALDLFSSDEIGAVVDVSPKDLKGFNQNNEVKYSPLLDVTYLTFDVKESPMDNPIFRRVVGMSMDRDELVHSIPSSVKTLRSFVPPGLIGYESNRGVRYDPDAAKELMHHSHYANMDKFDPIYLKVDLSSQSPATIEAAAENIRGQLKRALGVDIKLALKDDDIPKKARTIFLSHWAASVPDPDNFLAIFTGMSLNNPTGWKNRNYDEFVRQAATVKSVDAREKLYAKAQHILTETEMPVIPLYLNTQFCLVSPKIHHFPLNALGFMPFRAVTIE